MKVGTTILTMPRDKVSEFPLSLPSSDGGSNVNYKRRDSRYYSHLASLSFREFEENRGSKNQFFYTYYLTGLMSASLMHAVNLKTSPKKVDLDSHPYVSFLQNAARETFGMDASGENYLPTLMVLEEALHNPENLDDESRVEMIKFTKLISEGITNFGIRERNISYKGLEKLAERRDSNINEEEVVGMGTRASRGKPPELSDKAYGEMHPDLMAAWKEHKDKLYGTIFSLIRNREDTEELIQDTLIRANKGFANFRGDSAISTWLYRIGTNLAKNRYWYWKRRKRDVSDSLEGDGYDAVSQDHSSRATAELNEFSDRVARTMERISTQHREILVLRNVMNRSYEEIAATLGINVGTVKSRIARARENLRDKLNCGATEHDSIGLESQVESEDWGFRIATNEQHWKEA